MGLPNCVRYSYGSALSSDKNDVTRHTLLISGLDLISFSIFCRYEKAPKILRSVWNS